MTSDTPRPIDAGDIMTQDDIQARVGLSRNATADLVDRPGFPEPFHRVWRSRLWRTVDVEQWILVQQATRGVVYEPRHAGDSVH